MILRENYTALVTEDERNLAEELTLIAAKDVLRCLKTKCVLPLSLVNSGHIPTANSQNAQRGWSGTLRNRSSLQ